jgi:ubiquinone/menaquinone biosynthesis C-methylase UbiE
VISQALLDVVRCPDCRGAMRAESDELVCAVCGRRTRVTGREYLDLRPVETFVQSTKYLDDEMHADGRHAHVTPPLLTAAIRNDMLRSFLRIAAGDRVIDLGCGSGRVLVWNLAPDVHLVGVDVSPHFAEEALDRCDLLVGDLRQLPLEDGAFTRAYSLDVLEHLSREDLLRMLGEASRILSPGGTFFVYSHVRKNSRIAIGLRAINLLARGLERIGLLDLSHERLRKSDHRNALADIDDLHTVAGQAGFRVARIRYYTPLVGGFAENILKKMAEHLMERRAARRRGNSGEPSAESPGAVGARRTARTDAQRLIGNRGAVYTGLVALTWLMKLDLLLFGRIKSGPFFALLERLPTPAVGSTTTPH